MRDLVREISRNLLGEFEGPSDPEWPTGENSAHADYIPAFVQVELNWQFAEKNKLLLQIVTPSSLSPSLPPSLLHHRHYRHRYRHRHLYGKLPGDLNVSYLETVTITRPN